MRSSRLLLTLLSMALLCGTAAAQQLSGPSEAQQRERPPRPTHANVSYGPHKQNVMDIWLAESDQPTPVLFAIHGGGFRKGRKGVDPTLLTGCLKAKISVVAITYRFSQHAIAPASFHDAARAVQYVRSQSDPWNLAPQRIASTGGSAGAGISLWLAFHNDLADADNPDPVLRHSTRLTCAAVYNGQSSYDPRFIRKLFPENNTYQHSALAQLYDADLSQLDKLPEEKYRLFEEVSALPHVTRDDPPVLLMYATQLNTPIKSQGIGIHHPRFGKVLKEQLEELDIDCELHTGVKRNRGDMARLILPFVKRQFAADQPVARPTP